MTDPTFDPPLPPLDVPSWRKVWAEAEPSFRGAVIEMLVTDSHNRAMNTIKMRDVANGNPDLLALCERQAHLVETTRAAIEILREAAK